MTTAIKSTKDNHRKSHRFAFWAISLLAVVLVTGLTGCITINPPPASAPASAPAPAPTLTPSPTPAPVQSQRIQANMPAGSAVGSSASYSKQLTAGEQVNGFVELTGQYYSVDWSYNWHFQVLGPGGESLHDWTGHWANSPHHDFGFTASYAGKYTLRVSHASSYSKNLVIEIKPPGWGYSGP